jgi:erythromycin esterase-like protein
MRTAIDDALAYLRRVDSAAAADLHARLDWWLPHIRSRWAPGPHYTDLTTTDRDSLTAAIADLVTLLEHQQAKYIQASSEADYEWAYRSALGARAVDAMLRKLAANGSSDEGLRQATEVRDRMQAENLGWVVERLPPGGKVLVFAHLFHIAMTPIPYWGSEPARTDSAVAGMYLRRHFGDRLITIGNLFRRGTWYCGEGVQSRADAVQGSLARALGTLNQPLFLLDLRSAPQPVQSWLDQDRVLSDPYPWVRYELNVARGFDMLLFMDRVTPACPP